MKIFDRKHTFISRTGLILFFTVVLLAGCKKKDDNNADAEPETPAHIAVVHASPGGGELFFYVDSVKAHTTALNYTTVLDYADFKSGNPAFTITEKDKTTILTKTTFVMSSDNYYTVFITDLPSKPAFRISHDDLTAPAEGKAKIRFGNFSPDAGPLDLSVTGKTTPLVSNMPFQLMNGFDQTDPGEMNFEIRENGKSEVLASLANVKIEAGKIYTIWARGLKNGGSSTSKLELGVIVNK